MISKTKEAWVDHVKLFACVLVVLGHFAQSMVNADIQPETALYQWFNNTIYYFHVPLFFICSGYLYQKRSCVDSLKAWRAHVFKKGITLGVPYVVFSLVTWIIKTVFSGSVNIQNEGLLETMLFAPAPPYWFLYALFFIFLVTPTCRSKRMALGVLAAAVLLKCAKVFLGEPPIYAVSIVMENGIWFVLGMVMCTFDLARMCHGIRWLYLGLGLAAVFITGSVMMVVLELNFYLDTLVMGGLGCAAALLIIMNLFDKTVNAYVFQLFTSNTMPVFLMHTIFAAGLRVVLMKLEVQQPLPHILLGVAVSFAGPIAAAEIMKRIKLDFLFNPGKYIKFSK